MDSSFTARTHSAANKKTINSSPKATASSAWSPEVGRALEREPIRLS